MVMIMTSEECCSKSKRKHLECNGGGPDQICDCWCHHNRAQFLKELKDEREERKKEREWRKKHPGQKKPKKKHMFLTNMDIAAESMKRLLKKKRR